MSCRTGENQGFNVKNKQKQILASVNVSVCLSQYKEARKKACAQFSFSFSASDEVPGEIAGGESMAYVMLAVRLHQL